MIEKLHKPYRGDNKKWLYYVYYFLLFISWGVIFFMSISYKDDIWKILLFTNWIVLLIFFFIFSMRAPK